MPCPLLVPLGISDMPDTNDITSGSAEIAEAEHSNTLDAIQDIMGSQEPTIMVRLSTGQLQTQEAALAALLRSQIKHCSLIKETSPLISNISNAACNVWRRDVKCWTEAATTLPM